MESFAEPELAWSTISRILSFEHALPLRAKAHVASLDGSERVYSIEARPATGSWQVVDTATGAASRYSPSQGREVIRADGVAEASGTSDARPPRPLWLLFPLQLPVWGRPGDDWRPLAASAQGTRTTIHLSHTSERSLQAELELDTRLGSLTRFRNYAYEMWLSGREQL